MKTLHLISLCLTVFGSSAIAGVIAIPTGVTVQGVIEGDLVYPHPLGGDTIDYLTFEVTTTGPVRLIGTGLHFSQFLAMGVVVGGGEPFDIPGLPYLLFRETNEIDPEFTHLLDPGIYLVQAAEEAITHFYIIQFD